MNKNLIEEIEHIVDMFDNTYQEDKNKQQATSDKWQDEDKTTIWEKLFWFMLILVGCLYITHGHEILNKLIVDFIG